MSEPYDLIVDGTHIHLSTYANSKTEADKEFDSFLEKIRADAIKEFGHWLIDKGYDTSYCQYSDMNEWIEEYLKGEEEGALI